MNKLRHCHPMYRVKWRHSIIRGHITISMLWLVRQHGDCVKLSGQDLPRYTKKIDSVGSRKSPHFDCLKAKFHYASWFGAGSKLVRNRPPTSFEPASVMEFVFLLRKWCHNNKHFAELVKHHDGKTDGIGVVRRNNVIVIPRTQRQPAWR